MVELYPPDVVPIQGLQRCVCIAVLLHGKVCDPHNAMVKLFFTMPRNYIR